MTVQPLNPRGVYLDAYLQPLRVWLERSDVTDILINAPGEVWIETLGSPPERHLAPELTETALRRLAAQIAAFSHQGVNRESPLLSATLPDGARVQIVSPPATRGPMAIAHSQACGERSNASGLCRVRRFRPCPPRRPRRRGHKLCALRAALEEGRIADLLRMAVRSRKNIVVSGGTSTGKTTFLNALLKEIPRGTADRHRRHA